MFKEFKDNLGLQMALTELDDVVCDLRLGEAGWDDYYRQKGLVKLYLECIAGGCQTLDWQWLYDNDNLCEKDFEWFKDELGGLSLTLEQYEIKNEN